MKKHLFSTAILSFMVIGGTLVANAEDTKDASSKVTGKAKAGVMKIEAEDIDFGKLEIGGPIKTPSKKDGVMILDNSGGEGWKATVKNTSYESNKDTLSVKFNNIPLVGTDQVFSTGDSLLDEQYRDINATAEWGRAPEAGNYQSDLVWTLSPDLPDFDFKWGTANAKFIEPGVLFVENGQLAATWAIEDESGPVDLSGVTKLVFGDNVTMNASEDNGDEFSGFSELEEVEGLEKVDFSKMTSMNSTFAGSKIDAFDFSLIDTSNVVVFDSVFSMSNGSGSNLKDFDVSSAESLSGMFVYAAYDELDLTGWDTSNVTNFDMMFKEFSFNSATKGVSELNVSSATSMDSLFSGTGNLSLLNLSNWNVSNVKSMNWTFSGSNITGMDISNWDLSGLEIATTMFSRSSGDLKSTGVESIKFDSLVDTKQMFDGFNEDAPLNLNLNNMNMRNVTDATQMFRGANISNVEVSDWRFNSDNIGTSDISEVESKVFKDYKGTHSDTSNWLD